MQAFSRKMAGLLTASPFRLQQEIDSYFSASQHQLLILAHSPELLEDLRNDFCGLASVRTGVAPGNLFDPHITEKIYRELKGCRPFVPSQDQEILHEMEGFSAAKTVLAMLERCYRQHIAIVCPAGSIALSFVMSRPASPFMAVYSGNRLMVYNFSVGSLTGSINSRQTSEANVVQMSSPS